MPDARFRINGDATDQGFIATVGATLTLQLKTLPAIGVRRVRFLVPDPAAIDPTKSPVYNPPRASKGAPQLTLVGATSGADVSPATVGGTVTCTLPVLAPHSWIFRCVVNDGLQILPDGRTVLDPTLIHERMVVLRFNGRRCIIATETTQFEDDGWAGAYVDLLGTL